MRTSLLRAGIDATEFHRVEPASPSFYRNRMT